MIIKLLLLLIGVHYLVTITTLANHQNTSKFTRVICIVPSHDQFVANYTCRSKLVSRNMTVLNLYGRLIRQVDNITVSIKFYKKYNVYKPFLINVRENFCHLFTKHSSIPYTKLIMSIAGPYSNVNHSCPYNGEIFVKNLPMDASKLPDLWPSGEYRVDMFGTFNNNPIPSIQLQAFLEIGEKMFFG